MAITRAQQAKQMLQNGGRIGYRGGADMGAVGVEKDISGAIGSGSNEKISASDARDTNIDRAREIYQANQTLKLLEEDKAQEPFETLIIKDSNFPGFLGMGLNALKGPRQKLLDRNVDFFRFDPRTAKARQKYGLTAQGYKNYMSDRLAGTIDAAGNPIMTGDEDDSPFLYNTTLSQAQLPADDQETEEDEGLRLAYRANGGRIGFRIGSESDKDTSGKDYASDTAASKSVATSPSRDTGGDRNDNQPPSKTKTIPPEIKNAINLGGDISYLKNLIELNPVGIMKNIGGKLIMDKVFGDQTSLDTEDENMMLAFEPGSIKDKQLKQMYNIFEETGMQDPRMKGLMKEDIEQGGPLSLPEEAYQTAADGGRIGAAEGGIMDLETGRQMYFLGKLVKKATRAVKKVVKSPIGKAALVAGLGYGLGGGTFFGKTLPGVGTGGGFSFRNILPNLMGVKETGGVGEGFEGILGKIGLTKGFGSIMPTVGGGIAAASVVAGLLTPEQEDQAQLLADNTGIDIEEARNQILKAAAGQDDFRARAFKADGGIMRLGYQEGSKEPVAKKTMPLLDMGGKEMDLREDGGFVPIGRMEKADDVPARLSKNEFVFTADAVRNAGDGNVDKGAEVMYNMMKNLESGGDVSEESQGLEGARRMFQTSQRLEEVL